MRRSTGPPLRYLTLRVMRSRRRGGPERCADNSRHVVPINSVQRRPRNGGRAMEVLEISNRRCLASALHPPAGMNTDPKIVVVMPAYNAGRTLRLTYEELPKDTVTLVILVDDGSTDATLDVARQLGLEIF